MDTHLRDIFVRVAGGLMTPEEWLAWFEQNAALVEKTCGRTAFLKIKPKPSASTIRNRNIYSAQVAICDWLQSQGIHVERSEVYAQAWQREFDDFCAQQRQKEAALHDALEHKFGRLKASFPRFHRQLLESYREGDVVEAGASESQIAAMEKSLAVTLPDDLRVFFMSVSTLELYGLRISLDDLEFMMVGPHRFLVLGEYWLHGDGDKLLCDPATGSVLVYAHEFRPPKAIEVAGIFTDFLEKEIVRYLAEQ